MKIALASDHAGYELKEAIKDFLTEYEVIDFGTHSTESMDYPDTGFKAAEAVAKGDCERGILICGSGLGMSIVANKVKGIRAALCHSVELARLSRQHNDANILVLQGRFISKYLARDIINVWLSTEFDEGRHKQRVDKISRYEELPQD
ncbi:MAG: ribose 5-phosphate isomerase B [Candidatus Cloacimonetes bacterium]|nr:ribose 5-phosphate isomerase B [Candidatus Cloacimonadota bacterium]